MFNHTLSPAIGLLFSIYSLFYYLHPYSYPYSPFSNSIRRMSFLLFFLFAKLALPHFGISPRLKKLDSGTFACIISFICLAMMRDKVVFDETLILKIESVTLHVILRVLSAEVRVQTGETHSTNTHPLAPSIDPIDWHCLYCQYYLCLQCSCQTVPIGTISFTNASRG